MQHPAWYIAMRWAFPSLFFVKNGYQVYCQMLPKTYYSQNTIYVLKGNRMILFCCISTMIHYFIYKHAKLIFTKTCKWCGILYTLDYIGPIVGPKKFHYTFLSEIFVLKAHSFIWGSVSCALTLSLFALFYILFLLLANLLYLSLISYPTYICT